MKYGISIYYILSYFLLSSCTIYENHGYSLHTSSSVPLLLSASEEVVVRNMGTPSFISHLDQENWYYVGQTLEKEAFLTPHVVSQEIIKASFNKNIVINETQFNDKDIKAIHFDKHFTKSAGDDESLWREFIGNLGKYSVRPRYLEK